MFDLPVLENKENKECDSVGSSEDRTENSRETMPEERKSFGKTKKIKGLIIVQVDFPEGTPFNLQMKSGDTVQKLL